MTTDPYGDAGSATFGRGGQAPAAPGYGISEPFSSTSSTGASAVGGSTGSGSSGNQTVDAAKDQAGEVKDTATDAAQRVAGTAKDEAGNVLGEAKAQAGNLLDQVRGEAGSQVVTQKDRLAGLAHSYAKQLGSMASGSQESGPVTDLVHDLSNRVGGAGHWLENHEPADLLDEVRRFARRRPGAFLLSALTAGVVVGRLTRGAVDEARPDHTDAQAQRGYDGYSSTGPDAYAAPTYAEPATTVYGQSTPGYAEETVPGAGYGTQTGSTYSTGSTYGTTGDVVR